MEEEGGRQSAAPRKASAQAAANPSENCSQHPGTLATDWAASGAPLTRWEVTLSPGIKPNTVIELTEWPEAGAVAVA